MHETSKRVLYLYLAHKIADGPAQSDPPCEQDCGGLRKLTAKG